MGLGWNNTDFVNNKFTIARTIIQHPGEDYVQDYTKNDSSYRTLPMTQDVKRMLLEIKTEQERNRKLFGDCYYESDFVFTWPDGTVVTPNYLTSTFHDVLSKSSLPTVRLHDLRHSVASNLLANNFSIVEVQQWLGHSEASTTLNFYSHIDSSSKKNISKAIEKLLVLDVC